MSNWDLISSSMDLGPDCTDKILETEDMYGDWMMFWIDIHGQLWWVESLQGGKRQLVPDYFCGTATLRNNRVNDDSWRMPEAQVTFDKGRVVNVTPSKRVRHTD